MMLCRFFLAVAFLHGNGLRVALILLHAVAYVCPKSNGKLRQAEFYVVISKVY